MWRTALLISLCLSGCHRAPSPTSEPLAADAARTGESALTPGTDAGPAAPRPPPARTEPPASTQAPAAEPIEAEARCTRDEDCALTLLSDEGCCPMLCTPRALSTRALAQRQKSCANFQESSCPEPMCRPPPGVPSAVCQGGRCTVRFTPLD